MCVSAANRGTQHVVGWAVWWCSDWLLVKPSEEGGDNPRAHTDPSEPLPELPAAGVETSWGRCLSAEFSLQGHHYKDTQNSHLRARRDTERRPESCLVCFHGCCFFLFFSLGALRTSSSPPSDAGSAASGQGQIRVLASGRFRVSVKHTTLRLADKNNKEKKPGSAVDCLPIKGIMIFSDMSTGTNSPKVHPPNGTRFYTFQAS